MHYTEQMIPAAEQKRFMAAQVAADSISRQNSVRTYVKNQRKRVNYAMIVRGSRSLKMSRAQFCDALAALEMR